MHRNSHPLALVRSRAFTKLLAIDRAARRRFSESVQQGLECLGLLIEPKITADDYFCSPVNAIRFASNGAEANFSFLIFAGQVNDTTPIVLTCVGPGEQHNFIVGESLHDFLCLGYYRGFFALENMGYDTARAFQRVTSGRWKPKADADWSTGFGVNEEQRPVLQYLRKRMQLRPWRNPSKKFAKLQRTYLPHLELRTSLFTVGWEVDEFRAWKSWSDKR